MQTPCPLYFRRVVLKNVWAEWWGRWIRSAGLQPLPVARRLPGSVRGAGCFPGPAHRLLHRPGRCGSRVHSEVGKTSQSSCIPLCIHFIHSMSVVFFRPEVDLDGKNKGGWTPLMYASYIGHDNIANLLLEAGVNVNAATAKGVTPLMLAASCGKESIAFYLLQVPNKLMPYSVGVFRNLRGKCFSSFKSHILRHQSRETVGVSLIKLFFFFSFQQQGADLELKDCRGWTALFHCTSTGHQQMVKFLLDNNADANVK